MRTRGVKLVILPIQARFYYTESIFFRQDIYSIIHAPRVLSYHPIHLCTLYNGMIGYEVCLPCHLARTLKRKLAPKFPDERTVVVNVISLYFKLYLPHISRTYCVTTCDITMVQYVQEVVT